MDRTSTEVVTIEDLRAVTTEFAKRLGPAGNRHERRRLAALKREAR